MLTRKHINIWAEERDNDVLKDEFIACMMGVHVGDALGMPVEGFDYKTIKGSLICFFASSATLR